MKTIELTINGMSCNHCVMSVRKALEQVAGVTVEEVQIGKAKLQFDEAAVSTADLSAAIQKAGYTVTSL